MGSPFQRQLLLDADDSTPGRYRVDIHERWNCPIVPHGGLVTAIAAKAMATALDMPEQRLRSITSVFAGQVKPGPVTVDVTPIRKGRSISQLSATVCNEGEDAGLTCLAVFGASRVGYEFTDLEPPIDLPPVEECPSFRDRPSPFRDMFPFEFWEHVDSRMAQGHVQWEGHYEPTTSERVYWYRFDEPAVDDEGVWDPLTLVTLCDTMPGAVGERMGPDDTIWLPPSCDLTVHVLGDTKAEWIIGRNRARFAGDGYASADMELWDPDGRLLAYGTQVFFFVFPQGPPERLTPPH